EIVLDLGGAKQGRSQRRSSPVGGSTLNKTGMETPPREVDHYLVICQPGDFQNQDFGKVDRDEEGFLEGNHDDNVEEKNCSRKNLVKQAKKMKATSDKSHPPANIGDNVTIPIPDVDKGKGDLRNIIGVILQTNDEGFYKVGTKHGVLEKLYCRYGMINMSADWVS
ncbi:hypothetical protein ILUMI_18704, partial [Ignelater luminosus]